MIHLEFAGLHIDPKVIGEKNSKIQGPHIKRKNNCIVNTGGNIKLVSIVQELNRRMIDSRQVIKRGITGTHAQK